MRLDLEEILVVFFGHLGHKYCINKICGKISLQVPTSLCIQLLFRKNNRSNNGRPLGATGFVLLTLRFFSMSKIR